MELSLIEKAIRTAVEAHAGQMRKLGGVPFIVHPVAVGTILAKYGFPDAVIAAGFLHDVLEDTPYPPEKLRAEFGDEVYAIVRAVTHDSTLPWEEKKRGYIESVRRGPEGAKAVSTADKVHNLESLLYSYRTEGPAIWKHFNRGREAKLWFEESVLAMLRQTWSHPLVDEYEKLVREFRELQE